MARELLYEYNGKIKGIPARGIVSAHSMNAALRFISQLHSVDWDKWDTFTLWRDNDEKPCVIKDPSLNSKPTVKLEAGKSTSHTQPPPPVNKPQAVAKVVTATPPVKKWEEIPTNELDYSTRYTVVEAD